MTRTRTIIITDVGTVVQFALTPAGGINVVNSGGCPVEDIVAGRIDQSMSDEQIGAAVMTAWTQNYDGDPKANHLTVDVESTATPEDFAVTWVDEKGARVSGPTGEQVIEWETLRRAANQRDFELARLYTQIRQNALARMFATTRPSSICGWKNVGSNTFHLVARGIDGRYHGVREWDRSMLRLTVDDGQTYYSWLEVDKLGQDCAERNGLAYSRNTRDVL